MIKWSSIVLLFIYSFTPLWGQLELPDKPTSWVSDYAGVLSPAQEQTLDRMLSGLENRSSNQIFVAIFERMPENTYLEDFSVKLFEKWRPGLTAQDNGILIVIFTKNRKIRIEVGYGLEDVVTDAQSGTLIRNHIAPEFKKFNYYQGLRNALSELIPAVEGKYILPREGKSTGTGKGVSLNYFVIGFFILIMVLRIFRGPRSTGYGSRGRSTMLAPFFLGGFGGGRSGGGGFSGGGFGGGFGGMSGGGGASGSW